MLMFISTGCIENAWTDFRSEFPTPKQGKKCISICARKHLTFEVQPRNVVTHSTDIINMNTKDST